MALNKVLAFSFIFVGLLSLSSAALADASPGNKLCNYLSNEASKAKSKTDKDYLLSLGDALLDINKLRIQALNVKLTFEEFKKFAQKQGVQVSDSYKSTYLVGYVNKYCGQVQTEAGVSDKTTKAISSDQLKSFSKEPNADEHAYYEEAKAAK